MKKTPQMEEWSGDFGAKYIERNIKDMDSTYIKKFGKSRIEINNEFLDDLDRNIKILEIGSNVGLQLILLQKLGFKNLYGIEINEQAIETSKKLSERIYIIKGSAFDIPFKNSYFDLAFTSGVLIHISPKDILEAVSEIYRVSKKYIWGFEYFAEEYTEVEYRGRKDLLWKTNFAKIYLANFNGLRLLKEKKYKYLQNDNRDQMFLLEKISL